MDVLATCSADNVGIGKIADYLAEKDDPRLTEIVNILLSKTMAALTGQTCVSFWKANLAVEAITPEQWRR